MSRLPRVSGEDLLRALLRAGYAEFHAPSLVTVPVHGNRTLPLKTLQSILRQAGLNPDELSAFL